MLFAFGPFGTEIAPLSFPVPNALAQRWVGVLGYVGGALDFDAPKLQAEEGEVRVLALNLLFSTSSESAPATLSAP